MPCQSATFLMFTRTFYFAITQSCQFKTAFMCISAIFNLVNGKTWSFKSVRRWSNVTQYTCQLPNDKRRRMSLQCLHRTSNCHLSKETLPLVQNGRLTRAMSLQTSTTELEKITQLRKLAEKDIFKGNKMESFVVMFKEVNEDEEN